MGSHVLSLQSPTKDPALPAEYEQYPTIASLTHITNRYRIAITVTSVKQFTRAPPSPLFTFVNSLNASPIFIYTCISRSIRCHLQVTQHHQCSLLVKYYCYRKADTHWMYLYMYLYVFCCVCFLSQQNP